MKSQADRVLETIIVRKLQKTGISICSEESGILKITGDNKLRWIVDPLDGTVNFVRRLGSCGVSISLCQDDTPLWGVIGEYPSGKISWGGPGRGAFQDGKPLRVSSLSKRSQAILCTGFPARFNFDNSSLSWIKKTFSSFGKIRMLGSASLSLLQVAKGSAEAYSENNIMFWDVAAGLAILEGAGGLYRKTKSRHPGAFNIKACNGVSSFLIL